MSVRLILAVALLTSTAASAAPATTSDWVAISNVDTTHVLEAQAKFSPEDASSAGLAQYDGLASDLGPNINARYIAAMEVTRGQLQSRLQAEKNPQVRQDLEILISSIDDEITGTRLGEKYNLPWIDVPQMVFGGMQALLQEQLPATRRAKALERLQRYVGLYPGSVPVTEQAKALFMEKLGQPGLLGPVKARVDKSLANVPTYIKGIRELFVEMKIEGAEPALAAMEKQLTDYAEWERAKVLPTAREDFRLPPELYAYRLKRVGIDIDPQLLIQRAQVGFMETRAAMQALAPIVAKAKGIQATDYRDVIRALKKEAIPNDQLEARYKEVNTDAGGGDPPRGRGRRAEPADDHAPGLGGRIAAQPAPHMQPPPLIGNTGEQGQFVLPVGNPAATGKGEAYDDFNFPARVLDPERARGPSRPRAAVHRDGRARRVAGAHAVSPSTASTSKAGRCTPKPRWCRPSRRKAR